MGGILSNPATRWPRVFGKIQLFEDHPYLLPCLAAAVVAFLTFVIAFFGLKEVRTWCREGHRNKPHMLVRHCLPSSTVKMKKRPRKQNVIRKSLKLAPQIPSWTIIMASTMERPVLTAVLLQHPLNPPLILDANSKTRTLSLRLCAPSLNPKHFNLLLSTISSSPLPMPATMFSRH